MFAFIGAFTFCGAAFFAILVMAEMVRGYRSLIMAALSREPMPRMTQAPARIMRRRMTVPALRPQRRPERERAAA